MKYLLSSIIFLLLIYTGCGQKTPAVNEKRQIDTGYTYSNGTRDGTGKFYLGREIAQIMGAGGGAWLERQERDKEEGTQLVLDHLPLKQNSIVADIGAGTGYYSFKIADRVHGGRVFAVEIQDEFIRYLNNRIASSGVDNISVITGSNQSPNLPANSIDLAIMVDVYHELEFPHEMLQSLKLALKPGGMLLLLEYKKEDKTIPIKELHKMTVQQADKELTANGYLTKEHGTFLPWQHYLLYQKPL